MHPKFGIGKVVRSTDDEIVVRFFDTKRKFKQENAPLFSPTPQQRRDYQAVGARRQHKRLLTTPAAICEGCGLKPGAFYTRESSGRFCSKPCARSFCTRAKRKEINEKLSITMKSNENVKKTWFKPKAKAA
jgi:hypothetical protein